MSLYHCALCPSPLFFRAADVFVVYFLFTQRLERAIQKDSPYENIHPPPLVNTCRIVQPDLRRLAGDVCGDAGRLRR